MEVVQVENRNTFVAECAKNWIRWTRSNLPDIGSANMTTTQKANTIMDIQHR